MMHRGIPPMDTKNSGRKKKQKRKRRKKLKWQSNLSSKAVVLPQLTETTFFRRDLRCVQANRPTQMKAGSTEKVTPFVSHDANMYIWKMVSLPLSRTHSSHFLAGFFSNNFFLLFTHSRTCVMQTQAGFPPKTIWVVCSG